jgi:hypothetical protein
LPAGSALPSCPTAAPPAAAAFDEAFSIDMAWNTAVCRVVCMAARDDDGWLASGCYLPADPRPVGRRYLYGAAGRLAMASERSASPPRDRGSGYRVGSDWIRSVFGSAPGSTAACGAGRLLGRFGVHRTVLWNLRSG